VHSNRRVDAENSKRGLERGDDDDPTTNSEEASQYTGHRSGQQHCHNQAQQFHIRDCIIWRMSEPCIRHLFLVIALLVLTAVGNAQSQRTEHTFGLDHPDERPDATLADVAWLVGSWSGEEIREEKLVYRCRD